MRRIEFYGGGLYPAVKVDWLMMMMIIRIYIINPNFCILNSAYCALYKRHVLPYRPLKGCLLDDNMQPRSHVDVELLFTET